MGAEGLLVLTPAQLEAARELLRVGWIVLDDPVNAATVAAGVVQIARPGTWHGILIKAHPMEESDGSRRSFHISIITGGTA